MPRFAYAAHTRNAVFFLDDDGVCQDVAGSGAEAAPPELLRCIGAQYVASLDLREEAGLASLPREGASMLFVVADPHMRFSLVRTAPLERFETLADEADIVDLPDVTVTWPTTEVLARTLPIPPKALKLIAPPRPLRSPSTLSA
jgi:hypothetical protein